MYGVRCRQSARQCDQENLPELKRSLSGIMGLKRRRFAGVSWAKIQPRDSWYQSRNDRNSRRNVYEHCYSCGRSRGVTLTIMLVR